MIYTWPWQFREALMEDGWEEPCPEALEWCSMYAEPDWAWRACDRKDWMWWLLDYVFEGTLSHNPGTPNEIRQYFPEWPI